MLNIIQIILSCNNFKNYFFTAKLKHYHFSLIFFWIFFSESFENTYKRNSSVQFFWVLKNHPSSRISVLYLLYSFFFLLFEERDSQKFSLAIFIQIQQHESVLILMFTVYPYDCFNKTPLLFSLDYFKEMLSQST